MPRPVTLSPWSPDWGGRAEALIAEIAAAAPGVFLALHHVGSTAVPGLVAKPVIDLLAAIDDAIRAHAKALGL